MKSVWNAEDRRALLQRVERLTPERRGRWGSMNAPQMVVHLADAIRMASGELAVASRNVPILRHFPVKHLFVYCLPFPKGAPTAPELLARQPAAWTTEIVGLRQELEAFARRGPAATAPEHPAFGRMSGRAWGALVYRHMDHHLRQFGV
jgi:hypothetical protein